MRVVFDTNIYISAFVFPGGQAEHAIRGAAERRFSILISRPIILEVLEVLARKFGRDPEALSRTAIFLADLGEMVRPRKQVHILADDPDNRILECALAGHAEMIVTGDQAMLRLGACEGVSIVTLREFLDLTEI